MTKSGPIVFTCSFSGVNVTLISFASESKGRRIHRACTAHSCRHGDADSDLTETLVPEVLAIEAAVLCAFTSIPRLWCTRTLEGGELLFHETRGRGGKGGKAK